MKNYICKDLKKIGVFVFRNTKNAIWSSRFYNNETKHKFCLDVINSVDSLYDIADNNTISKMYCYHRLYFNVIKNECFKEPNINRKKIKKLFNKFLYSPYIIISKKKYLKKISNY